MPSHYRITAHEANTVQVLRVANRAGDVHDGKTSVCFLKDLFAQIDWTVARRPVLEMWIDEVFFGSDVIELLEEGGVEYATKIPFYP